MESTGSCQSPLSNSSAYPSKLTVKGAQANNNGDSVPQKKTLRKSLSKLPSHKSETTKGEGKLTNLKSKTRDLELEIQKTNGGETENPSKPADSQFQETESVEFHSEKDLPENAETSFTAPDAVIHPTEVAIAN